MTKYARQHHNQPSPFAMKLRGLLGTKRLEQIQQFIISYLISHIKIAVCFFGEERTLLNRAEAWKRFSSKLNIDFYAALYSNPNIYNNLIM
jgi:hypothetical protein